MNLRVSLGWLGLMISGLLAGCGPAQPTVVAVKRDDATILREWLYGARSSVAGVEWRASGLGMRILTPGVGDSPQLEDRVRVHYVCSLKDGKVIEDSHVKGVPGDFVLKRLIPGWMEGMGALRPGGKAELFIPPSLGYGTMGGGGVPAGAGLIFEVELIAVNPPVASKR